MNTGKLATSWINTLFSQAEGINPKVTEGDKGVSWDGAVEVYRSSGAYVSTDGYFDDVAIQVKGEQKPPAGESIRYSVRVADVRNYGTKSPTLYLVVRVGEDGRDHKAYYHVFRKGDYEGLPLRFDGQKTYTFTFDAFPTDPGEIRKLLIELVEERRGSRLPVCEPPVEERPKDRNLFLYDAEAIGFFGRGKEMEALDEFLKAEAPFRWWGITAPGGAGKSRLAFEFQKTLDLDTNSWQSHTLRLSDYDDLGGLIERYHTPLLLVADYAQMHVQALARLIAEQHDRDWSQPALRLLLLERDSGEEGGVFPWERQLLETVDGAYVSDARYRNVLHLRPLSDDAIMDIIRAYAEALYKQDGEGAHETGESSLSPLPDGKEKELLGRLSEFDEGYNRALYAMLLTNAVMHEPGRSDWSLQELLDGPLDREEKRLRYAVASLTPGRGDQPDRKLMNACSLIQRVATALGTAGDLAYGDMERLCPDALEVLEKQGYDP